MRARTRRSRQEKNCRCDAVDDLGTTLLICRGQFEDNASDRFHSCTRSEALGLSRVEGLFRLGFKIYVVSTFLWMT